MSNKTFPTGAFTYPVVHPNVKPLEAFTRRKLDTNSLTAFLEHMSMFARGVNPKVRVLWKSDIHTDHSITEKDGSWTIRANPLRMTRNSQHDASYESPVLTMNGMASTLGALLHEVAHTVYSPKTTAISKVTPDEFAVLGVLEDLYVNTQLVKQKLPGLKALLPHVYNWTNPRDMMSARVDNPQGMPTWYSEAVLALGADFMAIVNGKTNADFPEPWQAEFIQRIRPIRDRLASGNTLTWNQRLRLIQKTVKIAYGVLHKHGLYDPPLPSEGGQGDGGEGSASGDQSEGASGGGANEPGDDEVDGLGDTDGLEDVEVPKQEKSEYATCDGDDNHEDAQSGAGKRPVKMSGQLEQAIKNANAIAEAKQQGGTNDPGDYGEVDGCFIVPATESYDTNHYDKARANRLRQVFRTFSSVRRGWQHGTDAGRLSARRLPGLLGGTSKSVFKARAEIRGTQGAVLILSDGSGSMGRGKGSPYDAAAIAARELYEAIYHNSDYQVYAWAYSGSARQVDVISARYNQGQLLWPPADGGSTPSWKAMVEAAKYLKRKHPGKKRVIVHLTDLGWNDSYIADFDTHVINDPDLKYITIGIGNGSYYGGGGDYGDNAKMKVSRFKADDNIVAAIQEFSKQAFRG